jgi:hypothetical protein
MHCQRIGGEVFHVPPGKRWQVKPVIRPVKRVALCTAMRQSNYHIEAAAQGNNYFLLLMVGMAASDFATGYIIGPKHPLYFKRQLMWVLNKCKVSSRIGNFWEVYKLKRLHITTCLQDDRSKKWLKKIFYLIFIAKKIKQCLVSPIYIGFKYSGAVEN